MNYGNILLSGSVQHGNFYNCDEWILQKIDPIKQSKLNQAYYFYNKFDLMKLGFVKAELVNKDSNLYLKLKKHVMSYPNEWTLSMIKDATVFHLNLFEKVYSLDLALKSSSLHNVIFDYNKPIFTDLESITTRDEETFLPFRVSDNLFQTIFVKTLVEIELIRLKKLKEMREILSEARYFFASKKISKILLQVPELKDLLDESVKFHKKELYSKKTFIDQCRYLSDLIMSVNLASEFHNVQFSSDLVNRKIKQNIIQKVLSEYCPSTVLDIGAKDGQFSFLAAKQGCRVIAIEENDGLIDLIYLQAKKLDLKILPLVIPFNALSYRVSCDFVMCLDLIQRLVVEQKMQMDYIFKTLKDVTKRVLVLEFVGEVFSDSTNNDDYNIDNIKKSGLKYFSKVNVLDSYPVKNKILVFEK